MYKNFNAASLGISARLNELIELTLTYKFRSLDLDIMPLVQQTASRGIDYAKRFLTGSGVKIGSFDLPVNLAAEDESFQQDLQNLDQIAQVAQAIAATTCVLNLCPYSDQRPYHQNFELHCERIVQTADVLARYEIQLGLGFLAASQHRVGHRSQFIVSPDALLTLIKMVAAKNVGICLDTWNWHVGGGQVAQLRDWSAERVLMVRVADLPAGTALDTVSEQERMLPGATNVVPNQAWIDWLAAQGYNGPVTAYCHAAQFASGTRAQAIEQASDALDQLLQRGGAGEPKGVADSRATAAAH